jgi:hypothetical protein
VKVPGSKVCFFSSFQLVPLYAPDQYEIERLQQPRLDAQTTLEATMATMQGMLSERDSLRNPGGKSAAAAAAEELLAYEPAPAYEAPVYEPPVGTAVHAECS